MHVDYPISHDLQQLQYVTNTLSLSKSKQFDVIVPSIFDFERELRGKIAKFIPNTPNLCFVLQKIT